VSARGRGTALFITLLLGAPSLGACAGPAPKHAEPVARSGSPISFAYGTPQGEVFSSEGTRGRVTMVLFVTTFDLPSQVMAKRVEAVMRRHRPRTNAGAVALEAPNDAPLVDVFKTSLGLTYPVALTNTTRVDQLGPFGAIDQVPVLVVLDSRGVEVARAQGVVEEAEIEQALTRAERR
jgi:hypothetical protein